MYSTFDARNDTCEITVWHFRNDKGDTRLKLRVGMRVDKCNKMRSLHVKAQLWLISDSFKHRNFSGMDR